MNHIVLFFSHLYTFITFMEAISFSLRDCGQQCYSHNVSTETTNANVTSVVFSLFSFLISISTIKYNRSMIIVN